MGQVKKAVKKKARTTAKKKAAVKKTPAAKPKTKPQALKPRKKRAKPLPRVKKPAVIAVAVAKATGAKEIARGWQSQEAVAWIEKNCRVPEGKLVGQPVVLTNEQKNWLAMIYDTPTRLFILSMGRKNAKTAFAAFLLLLHLVGPKSIVNSQLFSAAQSREQAAILFNYAAKCVRMSPDLSLFVGIRDTAKQLFCAERGTLYRALSAEATTAMGLSPVFTVHDEFFHFLVAKTRSDKPRF